MKKAIITGINGQDGSYLAELLLEKGYKVYGIVKRSSIENSEKLKNIAHILDKVVLKTCSLENSLSVYKLFSSIMPDECYHLAASSFVSYDVEDDFSIMTNNFQTTHNILMSILEVCPQCRLYFAGSSEMFGNADSCPQYEKTPFNPRSIYGISKVSSHLLVKNYRERHGLYACTGITYNHESPRRDKSFVTRKITSSVANIYLGKQKSIELGSLDAVRDWGYAPEYVQAMHMMLQQEKAEDYVIATGKSHSVRELLEIAFNVVGLDYREYVRFNSSFVRPGESVNLIGDTRKIKEHLGWSTNKEFKDIIEEMVMYDIKTCHVV